MKILIIFLTFVVSTTTQNHDFSKRNNRGEEAFVENRRLFYRINETSPLIAVDPDQEDYFEQGISISFNEYYDSFWWSEDSNHLAYISADTRLVKTVSWNRYTDQEPYPEIVKQRYFKAFDNVPPYKISIWNSMTRLVKNIDFDHSQHTNGTTYFIYNIRQININNKDKLLIIYTNNYWNEIIAVTCEFETAKCQILFDYKYAEAQYLSFGAKVSEIYDNRLYLLLPLYFENENNSYQQIASFPINETVLEPRFEMREPYDVEKIEMKENKILFEAFSRNPFVRDNLELRLEPDQKPICVNCREMRSVDFIHFGKVPLGNGFEGLFKLILPLYKKGQKVPLYVSVYGGPESIAVTDGGFEFNDFAKLFIDGRGSGRRGWKYRSGSFGKLGTIDVQDQLTVIQYILKKYSNFLDEKNVLIAGWSYGGFMALAVAELAPKGFFKCAISGAPVTNFLYYRNNYSRRYMGNATISEYVDLTDNLENFRTTRLLLLHGMADNNVHFQNSAILIEKLHEAEIDFDLMVYPNSDHDVKHHLKSDKFHNDCFKM